MGVGRGQPHPLCQLGGGGPPFSLSPLEITDHDGLEKEKKGITNQVCLHTPRDISSIRLRMCKVPPTLT